MKKKIVITAVLALMLALLAGCGPQDDETAKAGQDTAQKTEQDQQGAQADSGAQNGEAAGAGSATAEPQPSLDADEYYQKLLACKEQIEAVTDFKPQIVLVLGSGLGDYADALDVKETIPYSSIKGWPDSTVAGHEGNLIFAEYKGMKVAVMQGRVHYYEGYSMDEVVLPLRVLHLLGADTVILTNAVGAINTDYSVGDFVCVRDHISSFVPSPLIGENIEELGERFTPMTEIYDQDMQDAVARIGAEKGIPVHSGVFLQVTGPHYESPAEIRMFRELGADTVGMSSVVEAIAAAHMGMKICDINCVTNMAAGIEEEFDHDSVSQKADESAANFKALINGLLDSLAE